MALYEPEQLSIHLTLVQQLHAQTIQNGYYFSNRAEYESANLANDMVTLVDAFVQLVLPSIKALQSQELVHRSIVATSIVPREGPIAERILETSQGTQVEQSLPSYCAAILTLRTGFGGKSNRGRSFYAGICEGLSASSRLDASSLTQLQSIGNQFISYFGNTQVLSPFRYMIFSRLKQGDGLSNDARAGGTVLSSLLGVYLVHRRILADHRTREWRNGHNEAQKALEENLRAEIQALKDKALMKAETTTPTTVEL